MFRGVVELSLDVKGRMAVPTRFREQLMAICEGRLVITVDTAEKCLAIYPLPEWEQLQPQLDALSSINPLTAMVKRQLLGNATDVDMDGNGRLLIPSKLRKHAMLTKKMVMIGQGKKFELWDEEHWDQRNESWQGVDLKSGEIPADLEALSL
ncbi:MAG: division/cell wall cluster transcriptional repressor MraZ [Gammaproteobacteria bacterium]|nr:division/cell wall cluster transcriptional repressor MraZ [Gammaproteobacteria bacterium]